MNAKAFSNVDHLQVTPDPMEGEQTWPTKEEIADAERAALLQKV